jgi:adenylate kinase
LDGFPRTLNQAKLLAKKVKIDRVIQIVCSPETVVARLGGRYTCRECGAIHNTRWEDVSKCRDCGGPLFQREDDYEAAIRKRLEQYRVQFSPILKYYTGNGGDLVTLSSELSESPEDIYRKYKAKCHGKI